MKRRSLIRWVCAAGIAAAIPLSAYAQTGAGNPNIVVILADDMGYGDAGCYNANSQIPTPHLDQMAGEGMRFTDAHTPSAVCSPTRYGLLTGRYAWRTEMKKGVLGAWDPPLIEKGRLTLASMLNQHDYHTACIGKWHLGWEWKTADGTALQIGQVKHEERVKLAEAVDYTQPLGGGAPGAGFETYFGDDAVNQPPYLWIENNRCMTQPTEPLLESIRKGSSNGPATPGWDQINVLPRMTERAVQYIHERGKQDKPFFLYLALSAPHVPVMPNKPYIGKSVYGPYGDFVHQVDDIVGQITDALGETGLAEDTLVIFSSDNGSFANPKKGHSPNGELRGKKGRIFEGGHRVPFLVRWPGRIRGGSVNHQLVGVHDVMATAAAIVGHKLPADAAEDSANLLPTLLNASKSVRQDLVHHSRSGEFAIRDGDWKLITDDKRDPVLLFNIGKDLAEHNDLSDQHPEVVKRLADKLEMQCQSGRSINRDRSLQSMFYKAQHEETGNMWDVWLYHHEGTYFLYYLANEGARASKGQPWNNISLATSPDGVHWTEKGPILKKSKGATWMGTGSTWKSPTFDKDGKFYMNFSEEIGERQNIYFAESKDLRNWTRLEGEEYRFVQDERWYGKNGRWDCIWTLPKPGGGLYGYWTASPLSKDSKFGFGESKDGLHWKALEPPKVSGVKRRHAEVGAVEKIGDNYYMLLGNYPPYMVTLVADQPEGPFRSAKKNFNVLTGHTYFCRFFPHPTDGMLVCHFTRARDKQVSFAPLKDVRIDNEGTLRLGWWKGNEKMKHVSIKVETPADPGKAIAMLGNVFDVKRGTILEGRLRLPKDKDAQPSGLYIECVNNGAAAVLVDSAGVAELGSIQADGTGLKVKERKKRDLKRVDREMTFTNPARFRLLLKGSLMEFYLDDILVESFALPGKATGRIGFINSVDTVGTLKAWK